MECGDLINRYGIVKSNIFVSALYIQKFSHILEHPEDRKHYPTFNSFLKRNYQLNGKRLYL